MLKRYQHIVGGTFRIVDACVIGSVWLASYYLRFFVPLVPVTKGLPGFSKYAALLPVVMALWILVFSSMGVYRSKRMLRRTDEAYLILRAHFVGMLFFIALTYMFSEYRYSRLVMGYFGILGAVLLVFFRLLLRNMLRAIRRRGKNLRHVLAIGAGEPLRHLFWRFEKFPELGLRVQGVVVESSLSVKEVFGHPVLGHYESLPQIIKEHRPDQILIALPRKQYGELDEILKMIRDETVDIRMVPDVHEFVTLGCEVEDFDGHPVVNLNGSPLDGWGAILKRMTDIIVSVLALLLLSPVLLLIGLLVKISSRGPIFYGQTRMGLDGRTFRMYKFRSMRLDAEDQSGAVWAKKSDDRRTWVGTLLRSTSLDELPQLWNILVGDMSLVGPRPERPVFVEKFRGEIPHYMLRHKVKAGLTGWAQVNGWRGDTSLDRRIECDLYYIRNWSYALDWKIMVMTLWKGFVNKNAY